MLIYQNHIQKQQFKTKSLKKNAFTRISFKNYPAESPSVKVFYKNYYSWGIFSKNSVRYNKK